ncbi:MAG: hypothetical protein AB1Z23_03195 [Eubacteriales bacterium]
MASEFDFLRGKWPKLAAIAADASRLVDIIPASAMKSLEKFTMWSADVALDIYEIQVPGGATQLEKLEALQACGYVPVEILQKFHNVRTAAGRQINDINSSIDLANACLSDCREIGQWLSRESDKSGFAPTQQFTPEYKVPISGMGSYSPEPDMMPSGYRFNRFMRQYGAYVTLFIAILVLAGAGIGISKLFSSKKEQLSEPNMEAFVTPNQVFTTDPNIVQITPEPEPSEEPAPEYVLIDSMQPMEPFSKGGKLYITKWNVTKERPFQNANQVYSSGIGMFIPSKVISKDWGNDTITYNLQGLYEKIQFDLFVDVEGSYGISSEYGYYDVRMYADGVEIYNSLLDEYMMYNDVLNDQVVMLPQGTLQLKIMLTQKKGTKGTLDVVLGDFFLYPYDTQN